MNDADLLELMTADSLDAYHAALARLYSEGKITLEDVIGTLIDEDIVLNGTGELPKIAGVIRAVEGVSE